jgi:Adenylate and Guanylate cyclase catalytic domain.
LSTGSNGGRDKSIYKVLEYLHTINLATPLDAPKDSVQCGLFAKSIEAWLGSQTHVEASNDEHFEILILANIQPSRCGINETILLPDEHLPSTYKWQDMSLRDIEHVLGVRTGSFVEVSQYDDDTGFRTSAVYNLSDIIIRSAFNQFMMQLTLFLLTIACLGFMRADASRLVLAPLRRMLKAIARFAENPLVGFGKDEMSNELAIKSSSNIDRHAPDNDTEESNLGSYETEQITRAVTKITDLLQKCWGVAGAGIISSNLARNNDGKNTVVFNPNVPGKLVYAIFGFAGINDFSHLLRALDKDVMALINDVARVVHNEVYRWGFGESGQCNKNLGSAFLMVYRIGDFEEVREKKARAANVFFEKSGRTLDRSTSKSDASHRRIEDEVNSIQLASLPGISGFADRALLGFFKSYAGLNREKEVKKWESDYRLGAGVGAFSVEMSFGMDAGWAVEGAVGSIYKIDATYLSTHVNMASRMMSACKQYKVSILISQAMEEMLTRSAKKVMRHIDTVYAKGSSKKQRIYTLDVRHQGADLFLHKRSETEANKEADNYSHKIWLKDQDLRDMRSHVTPEFEEAFKEGLRNYLNGKFGEALKYLKMANEIMIETVVSDGRLAYVNAIGDKLLDSSSNDKEVIHLRKEIGDGPSQTLIAFIEKYDGIAPSGWNGVRQLMNK